MLSQLINTTKHDNVRIDALRLDGGTQPRHGINAAYVDELAESIVEGATLPPVEVIYDGANYWLYDGFHRVAAHQAAGILIVDANIHQGTQADAQWRSYAANQTHGLRRTNEDKQRAIKAALRHPNGVTMANREIARHLGVDHKTVGDWREKLEATGEIPQSTTRTGADGRTIDTTNIGTNQPATQPGTPLTEEQIDEFLAYYWRGAELQAIADSHDPRGVLRSLTVRDRAGGSGGRWRYQARSGKVECWDGGDYFARPADGVWTYDQFARLSLRVLPSPSWVQQPDDLGSADVEQRIRAAIDGMYAQPVDADPESARPQPAFANPSPSALIENSIDTLAWEARPTSPQARIDHMMNPTNFAYYRDNVQNRTGLQVSGATINDALMAVIADTRERNDVAANAAAATVQIIEYDAAAPLPDWAADDPDPDRTPAQRPLTGKELCTALLGQAIVDVYNLPGSVRLILDNNQTITINGAGLHFTVKEA